MKRKYTLVRLGCMVAVAASLAAWLLRRTGDAPLQRLPFAVVSGEPLHYNLSLFDWLSRGTPVGAGQAIADGQGVAFREHAKL